MIRKTSVRDAIDLIYKLDCVAYIEEPTTKEWYLRRYKGKEVIYIYDCDGKDVAYFAVMNIRRELARAIINGVLDGDVSVSNKMFDGDGEYFYLGSCVVDENYRGQGIFSELFDKVLEDYQGKTLVALANKHTVKAAENRGFVALKDNGKYTSIIKSQNFY